VIRPPSGPASSCRTGEAVNQHHGRVGERLGESRLDQAAMQCGLGHLADRKVGLRLIARFHAGHRKIVPGHWGVEAPRAALAPHQRRSSRIAPAILEVRQGIARQMLDSPRARRTAELAERQPGCRSANCGSASVISNQGAFDATKMWLRGRTPGSPSSAPSDHRETAIGVDARHRRAAGAAEGLREELRSGTL